MPLEKWVFIWILEVVLVELFSKIQRKIDFSTYFWNKFQKNYKYLREEKSSYFRRKTQLFSLVPMAKGYYSTSILAFLTSLTGATLEFWFDFLHTTFHERHDAIGKNENPLEPGSSFDRKNFFFGPFFEINYQIIMRASRGSGAPLGALSSIQAISQEKKTGCFRKKYNFSPWASKSMAIAH